MLFAPCLQAAESASGDSAGEQQSLEELRNTVVNLLQTLVDKGLMTREQAQQLVRQAQDKAAADATARAAQNNAQEKTEENAVRVPYVPQIIQDQISKQVAQQVQPVVVANVVKEAKAEGWGVPGALPDWISRVQLYGDVTLRGQADMYAKDNVAPPTKPNDPIPPLDFSAINQAGGIDKAATPFLNTTQNRERLRLKAHLGVLATLTPSWTAGLRLSAGSLTDPSSESQNEGTYGDRYPVGIDAAFLRWDGRREGYVPWMTAQGGRTDNPWFSPTELVYARDLTFEGVNDTVRLPFGKGQNPSMVYLTGGVSQMLEVPLNNPKDKWMVGAQLGTNLRWSEGRERLRIAGAYYDFIHVTGVKNQPDSTLTNYTAPAFIRYGNTYYDISNSTTDPTVNLFGLAAHFRLADVAATYERDVGSHVFTINVEAVRNLGYKLTDVEALSEQTMPRAENIGYVGEFGFGDASVAQAGQWRARLGYRYVRRDAVLDAWTDADFHGAGTNAEGYYWWTEIGLGSGVWVRVRYMSGNEVDGPRYGLDVLQVDMNARF
jgi:hypothetical protein